MIMNKDILMKCMVLDVVLPAVKTETKIPSITNIRPWFAAQTPTHHPVGRRCISYRTSCEYRMQIIRYIGQCGQTAKSAQHRLLSMKVCVPMLISCVNIVLLRPENIMLVLPEP